MKVKVSKKLVHVPKQSSTASTVGFYTEPMDKYVASKVGFVDRVLNGSRGTYSFDCSSVSFNFVDG